MCTDGGFLAGMLIYSINENMLFFLIVYFTMIIF